MFEQVA